MHIAPWLLYTLIFGGGTSVGGLAVWWASGIGQKLMIIGLVGAGVYAYTKAK